MPIPALSTPRLLLPPLTLADAPAIQHAFARREIVRFLADRVPWPYPEDGALVFLRDAALPAMAQGREWHWSLRPRQEPGRLIGVVSLMDDPDNNRGFWIVPEWQGQGLMTEAAEAVTAYWFDVLGKPRLRVPKAAANIASSRISARGGMRMVATEERGYVSGRLPSEIWEITREEWLARRKGQAAGG
ncbi:MULTISPECIES: GNAT family N-acetyltransferase [Pigmentiphaga]|uniref:GNAT family N-acetyltransferase n=1 Tax=Pigmentiphaga daeguensis TaxID=414049 RepID=A0ABN1C2F9_9BURK|nr:GNAT family N-acetyltransferase [Pigmentiphaga sp. D-2]